MPTKRLPQAANIDHLKYQARDLLRAARAGEMQAFQRLREFHPKHHAKPDADLAQTLITLSDAQLCIAREYGYASWPRLREVVAGEGATPPHQTHNERIIDAAFRQALDLMDEGDAKRLRAHLAAHPGLAVMRVRFEGDNYFTNPALVEFIAENPIRTGRLPHTAPEVLDVLLQAGSTEDPDALNSTVELLASGRVARESGLEEVLVRKLVAAGADPAKAIHAAIAHGELASVRLLIALGAPMDAAIAAGLGDAVLLQEHLPHASPDTLQLGLAWAACLGQTACVALLLDAGADPDRFNPPGGHSHCTPLHSAVWEGHLDVVRLLVTRGARMDIGDIHHKATPLDWARHAGQAEVLTFLEGQTTPGRPG